MPDTQTYTADIFDYVPCKFVLSSRILGHWSSRRYSAPERDPPLRAWVMGGWGPVAVDASGSNRLSLPYRSPLCGEQ